MNYNLQPANSQSRRPWSLSRRHMVIGSAMAGLAGTIGFSALTQRPARAAHGEAARNDIDILNGALYYEHQAIWAYNTAAGKLSNSEVGKAVMAIALANQADHMTHRDTLAEVIRNLGGDPVMAESSYDLSSYLENGDGGLESDVNIAKLALALETDAAIAYANEISKLMTPELVTAGASIASAEASHATTIRAAFVSLGMDIAYVPAAFVSSNTRDQWVLKV